MNNQIYYLLMKNGYLDSSLLNNFKYEISLFHKPYEKLDDMFFAIQLLIKRII